MPSPQSPLVQWNVQPFALSHGVTNVAQLVQATGLPKQSLYGLWRGETSQISVAVLGKLCLGLDARPGDWFVWEGEGEERRLAWNIAVVAERMGLTAPQLAFRAGIYYRMIQLYWQGTTQSVFIQTLGKLARALAAEDRPFDIGDLFTWRTEPVTAEPNSVAPRADP